MLIPVFNSHAHMRPDQIHNPYSTGLHVSILEPNKAKPRKLGKVVQMFQSKYPYERLTS